MLKKRAGGILLHITSLPTKYGIGDLGPEAFKFVDFLAKCLQHCWQVLPLNHTASQKGHSPYNCSSAFAGNPLLISPYYLYEDMLLTRPEMKDGLPVFSENCVEFELVSAYKEQLFRLAFERFQERAMPEGYEQFTAENSFWLDDFAVFVSLQKQFRGVSWSDWPSGLRDRKTDDLKSARKELRKEIEYQTFLQYEFYKQWSDLKRYCTQAGVEVIGDIPIYVTDNSPDVWAHPELFKLDANKKPRYIAGVPPDYFSRTGQLWGNPVYDWPALRKTGYHWWMERLGHNLKMFDIVRIDHFRGLVGYWQVPAGHKTAKNGRWVKGPGDDFFKTLLRHFPQAPFIAEDLGHITDDVRKIIKKFDLPTMKVLQFAFSGNPSKNPHLPDNCTENCIVYTGTHDNNTTRGWFENEADKQQKKRLEEYIGKKVTPDTVCSELIKLAMSSVAKLAIIPAQDLLNLPASARMNNPAKDKGNWLWRLPPARLDLSVSRKLKQLTEKYKR